MNNLPCLKKYKTWFFGKKYFKLLQTESSPNTFYTLYNEVHLIVYKGNVQQMFEICLFSKYQYLRGPSSFGHYRFPPKGFPHLLSNLTTSWKKEAVKCNQSCRSVKPEIPEIYTGNVSRFTSWLNAASFNFLHLLYECVCMSWKGWNVL